MRTAIDRLVGWVSSRRYGPGPSVLVGTLPPSSCGEEPRNPLLLSAYQDDALSVEERRMVDSHLPHCQSCRARLADYKNMAGDIRLQGPQAVPYSLDRRVAALATAGRRGAVTPAPLAPWLLRPALAVTALGLIVAVVLISGIPFVGNESPMVAAAYLADDQGEQTFVIRFASPVDQEKVEQSLKVDPPISVKVEWRGQTMLVKPTERVEASSIYTVRLQPRGPAASEAPVAVRFDSREPARALAQQDSGPRQPRPTGTAPMAAAAPTQPTESPTA
ncbi:MAG TPA: zf-HC2 domain-containing protein, partial [Chloroflexota bacterium]|nr:zf-HC2 domain-containing protein [Chloroflexota bacterium]